MPLRDRRVDDTHDRAPCTGDEVGRRIAGDPLDLVADELEPVPGVPGRAIDRAGHVEQQRAEQRGVRALLHRPQARAGPGEELRAGERPMQVVVGADVEGGVGHPSPRRSDDREQPGVAQPGIVTQRATHGGRIEAGRLAVGEDEVDRVLA